MTRAATTLVRIVQIFAIAGFWWGVGCATRFVLTHEFVREFQSGDPSPLSERALAVAQRGALEGLGFAALALGAAILGRFVGIARARLRPKAEIDPSQELIAGFVVAAAGFAAWVYFGTWLGSEFLPFLAPRELLLLNAAGFGALFLGFLAFDSIVRALPWSARRAPDAVAVASVLACAGAAWLGLLLVKGTGGGWKSPPRLALVSLGFVAALPVAAVASRGCASLFASARAILKGRPPVPSWIGLPSIVALGVCIAVFGFTASFSALPPAVSYAKLASPGAPAGPNVILITVDTLRADHLGSYGYQRPTSPYLDSLAASGTRYEDAVAPAAWTKPSTGTILTGLYPSRHGALYHGSELHTPPGCKTLAEAFRDAGYVTAAFVSNPNVKKIFKFDRGFQEFFDSPVEDTVTLSTFRNAVIGNILTEITRYQFNWKYENDVRQINNHAFSWLERNNDRKFFLYLHYIDPHEPYAPPREYAEQFARDHGFVLHNDRKRLVGTDLYDGEIRYTDDNLLELSNLLKRLKRLDDTVIVVTSDHGEEFFEHGTLGHGFSLYQEVVHVPLIASGPGIEKGKVVKSPVAIVDLAATILDIVGIGGAKFGDGTSFAASMADAKWKKEGESYMENEFGEDDTDLRSFVMWGVRDGDWKFILNERNAYRPPEDPKYGTFELYDLAADPGERKNLMKDPTKKALIEDRWHALQDRLTKHSAFLEEPGFRKIKPGPISPEIEAALSAIGYLKGKK